jgi:hypothetical protein
MDGKCKLLQSTKGAQRATLHPKKTSNEPKSARAAWRQCYVRFGRKEGPRQPVWDFSPKLNEQRLVAARRHDRVGSAFSARGHGISCPFVAGTIYLMIGFASLHARFKQQH